MLRVDLGQLDREGSVVVEASVSAEDELWKGTDLNWDGDVAVTLRATFAGTGEVVARGNLEGRLRQECRRCLKPVDTPFVQELTLVFVSDGSEEEGEGGAYGFDPGSAELDLSEQSARKWSSRSILVWFAIRSAKGSVRIAVRT